ncbi:long-chain fatty acid--CoA ligase [Pseudoalteromonas sp. JBTF-M23]|uniref:Long-chain fatty acid--CoA ligase n=1 Tax=Pseudoalteromonas caenipelagi TaxID=2726988 RepID=A0A849VK06_9GAMM|nr:AMP-binding protein [Pseudoalteromonas caenipelagi]NOU51947.1 long-chain fatty acid--CoA ligase [Pseudoalteromonas caenipelagi]
MHNVISMAPIQFNPTTSATICDDNNSVSYHAFNQLIRDYHEALLDVPCSEVFVLSITQSIHCLALMLACFGLKKTAVLRASTSEIPTQLKECDQFELDANQLLCRTQAQVVGQSSHMQGNTEQTCGDSQGMLGFLSSGSVGEPKVIFHQPDSLVANSQNALNLLPLSLQDNVLIPVPISHMYGFGAAALSSLCAGASVCLTQGLNLLKWKQIEKTWQPSCVFFTSSLLDAVSAKLSDKHVLKLIVTAGDCVNTRYLNAWVNKTQFWLNLYGSTEMGVIGIASLINQGLLNSDAEQAYFTPCPGVDVASVNEQLEVHQMHAFVGYLNSNASIAMSPAHPQFFNVAEKPFKTGDLGKLASDGRFSVHGRADFSVNREGRLLAFAQLEIELKKQALNLDVFVQELALVCGPQDSKGKTLIACCEGVTESQFSALKQAWRSHLPAYAVPSQIKLVDPLPRLANGKLNRRKLEEVISHV